MEITYNEQQIGVLVNRMSFLKNIKTGLFVATVVLLLVVALGIVAIWMSLPLVGVIMCIIGIIPLIVAIGLLRTMMLLVKMLKKKTYKIFRVKCSNSQHISESPLWRRVKTTDNIETYFYAGDPIADLKHGDEFDILVHEKKKVLMFGIFAISE